MILKVSILALFLSTNYIIVASGLKHNSASVNRNNISALCNDPDCLENDAISLFCKNVNVNFFECGRYNLPFYLVCDGTEHCLDGTDEDPTVCALLNCDENQFKCVSTECIALSNLANGIKDSRGGSDESDNICDVGIDLNTIKSEVKACPALVGNDITATCYANQPDRFGGIISCSHMLFPGYQAEISCKRYFTSTTGLNYQVVSCQEDGNWDKPIMECVPDCGRINDVEMQPMIINGSDINPTLWPWYVALFYQEDSNYRFFCSGTIVSNEFVLTAAHCVWKVPKYLIRVAAGKTFSNFLNNEDNSRNSEVDKIFIHPIYQDSFGNYGSDIAILKLKNPFVFSKQVLPICMNWKLRNMIKDISGDVIGQVAGMGLTEFGNISNVLRVAKIKIIRTQECLLQQQYEFRKYLSVASICGKGVEGEVVCNGDSGSGLGVKDRISGQWVLEGIVSISLKRPQRALCEKDPATIYTNVGMYVNWIRDIVLKKP